MLLFLALLGVILFALYWKLASRSSLSLQQLGHPFYHGRWNLYQVQSILKAAPVPIIHEDAILQNAESIWATARLSKKNLRVATKSIRVPALIDLVTRIGTHPALLMCYSVKEAVFLIEWSQKTHGMNKFRDVLVAYPTVNRQDVLSAHQQNQLGNKITLMVDSIDHITALTEILKSNTKETETIKLPVCVDVDASLRVARGLLHLGAHRSPCHSAEQFEEIVLQLKNDPTALRLAGVMTYEAQIAGVGDASVFNSRLYNWAIRLMKYVSKKHVKTLRQQIQRILQEHQVTLDFFNGGGTGNIEEASLDPNLTEVTAGSGFLQPTLFDYYLDNMCSPALAIALQVTRIQKSRTRPATPTKQSVQVSEVVCCQSGGFIASGPASKDKEPAMFLPRGLNPFEDEGFGEVQTPLQVSQELQEALLDPKLGDYVLIRPAKSGEVAERFPKYLLINAETSAEKPPEVLVTYRGFGKAFF